MSTNVTFLLIGDDDDQDNERDDEKKPLGPGPVKRNGDTR